MPISYIHWLGSLLMVIVAVVGRGYGDGIGVRRRIADKAVLEKRGIPGLGFIGFGFVFTPCCHRLQSPSPGP